MALDRGRQTLGCDLRRERRRVFGAGTETIPYRTNALPREMLENSGVGLLSTTGTASRRGPRSPKMGLLKFIPRIAMGRTTLSAATVDLQSFDDRIIEQVT